MDEMFVEDTWEEPTSTDKHKEEGHNSRLLVKTNKMKIQDELDKYPYPLKESKPRQSVQHRLVRRMNGIRLQSFPSGWIFKPY